MTMQRKRLDRYWKLNVTRVFYTILLLFSIYRALQMIDNNLKKKRLKRLLLINPYKSIDKATGHGD